MAETMIACVAHGPGDLRIEERPAVSPPAGHVCVTIAYGGICGSDLHYYHDGAVGDFALVEPLVLGHEVVGRVHSLGSGVSGPAIGTPVAIHPATPCGQCPECEDQRRNVCRNTRYLGSAARLPHVQGGFSGRVAVPADQVIALPAGLDLRTAALAEPLSVALHAVRRAGDVVGRDVLVTGAGPIGCLVTAVLHASGARSIVVADLVEEALEIAAAVGASSVVRADRPEDPRWPSQVSVAIEASGAAAAVQTCVERTCRGGTVVQLGLLPPGTAAVPGNLLVTREITVTGAFRFDTELTEALDLLAHGIYVKPVISHVFPAAEAADAFTVASDRRRSCKVLLDFS